MPLTKLSFLLVLLLLHGTAHSLPLATNGRWIVDAAMGQRVKLRCVNWAAHMPAVLAEGLDKQPVRAIAAQVASLGFNCVRLTWATYMWTSDEQYGNLTVAESLRNLGLDRAAEGIGRNNPEMLALTVREAYDEVVRAVGEAGVMVVLDNHVSRPQWCCGGDDGNGFFGDLYFDPEEWVGGLEIVAKRFRGFPQVVGMSMRNELRGPNQTQPAWYLNIARGARAIHAANPDVLLIVSGLSFDTDLTFLSRRPLPSLYDHKLVLEAHWYANTDGRHRDWADAPLNPVCSRAARRFDERAGFVARPGRNGAVPLFVSEFGGDQRGGNRADNRFLSCFAAFAAERDLDWAMWALQGSYYRRHGVDGFEETFGVLDSGWDRPKNPRFRERFRMLQMMTQDPRSSSAPYQLIYHPPSGQCLSVDKEKNVVLRDCETRSKWDYKGRGTLALLEGGATLCLGLSGDGHPALLSNKCDDKQSFLWRAESSSGFGIVGMDAEGRKLCLDAGSTNSSLVLTKECTCLDNSTCFEDPRSQWFRLVSSNI